MKRKNKCVATKHAYKTKRACLTTARKVYESRGTLLRYYECPVCLDFHLTSNITDSERRVVKKELGQFIFQANMEKAGKSKSAEKRKRLSKQIIEKQYREFKRLYLFHCRRLGIVGRGKEKTILVGVLPREERLKILAKMKAKQEKTTLWKTLTSTIITWYNSR